MLYDYVNQCKLYHRIVWKVPTSTCTTALISKYITSRSFECMNHISCTSIPLPYSWSDWGSTWYNWGCLNHLLIVICFLLSRLCALMRSASRISSTSVKNSAEVCSRNCLSFWDQYCKAFFTPNSCWCWPVWPDWAIFESSWWHGFYEK